MTAAITTLRSTIAAALTDNTLWQVFSFPPPTITANSLVISPADPYISPTNNKYSTISPMANFVINLFCPLLDNQGNLQYMENMIVSAFSLLSASSIVFVIGDVSAPTVMDAPSGSLLTTTMNLSILTSWS